MAETSQTPVAHALSAALQPDDWDAIGNMLGQSLQQHMQQAQFHQKEIQRIQPIIQKLQAQLQGRPPSQRPQNGATAAEAAPPPPADTPAA